MRHPNGYMPHGEQHSTKCRNGRFDAQQKEDEAAGMLREVASNREVTSLIIGHQSIQQVIILVDCIARFV